MRRRRCILRLIAAAIMRRVVVSKATRNKVVKATDTMSATAGKTHSAHLRKTQRLGLGCWLVSSVGGEGRRVKYTLVHRLLSNGWLVHAHDFGHD